MFARVLDRLAQVHRTSGEVLLFTASGTGSMDGAVANTCSPGDRVVVVSAGNFGERWVAIAEAYGCEVVHVRYEWGETPRAEDVASALAEAGGATAVFMTQSETSTGVVADVEAMAGVVAATEALLVVDAISSLGAVPLETEAWGVDVVVAGSQKALMTPPGLATAAVSDAAWAAAERSTSPRFYFDWARERTAQAEEPPVTAFTPAISLVYGLDAALGLLLEEGLDAAFARHVRLGRAARAGVKALGLELFSPDEDRSAVVTAIRMPDGVNGVDVIRTVAERHGITLEGGRGPLAGKIVRIGHVGYISIEDVVAGLRALAETLSADADAAASAALEAYA